MLEGAAVGARVCAGRVGAALVGEAEAEKRHAVEAFRKRDDALARLKEVTSERDKASAEVAAVLNARAAAVGAELRWVAPLDLQHWPLGLPGAVQANNGAVALGMLRALAKRAGLPVVAHKPDSQEICFVPDGDHARVVEGALGPRPAGELVHINGRPLGRHRGVHHFTVGQRRGTHIASPIEGSASTSSTSTLRPTP